MLFIEYLNTVQNKTIFLWVHLQKDMYNLRVVFWWEGIELNEEEGDCGEL